jgi:hypothetical protein
MFIQAMRFSDFLSKGPVRIDIRRLLFVPMVTLTALVLVGNSPSRASAAGSSTFNPALLKRQTNTFGSLGFVAGQTVRLSAVRHDDGGDTVYCRVDLSIFDFLGNQQAAVSANLGPGKGALLDLPWENITPPQNQPRVQVSAAADVTSILKNGSPPVMSRCRLRFSISRADAAL